MSSNWVKDINEMQTKYGVHEWIQSADEDRLRSYLHFRIDFLREELDETEAALVSLDSEEIVDGLIDLCVVAIGTLDAFGVDPYKAWDEVLKANMNKTCLLPLPHSHCNSMEPAFGRLEHPSCYGIHGIG